ncbi:MAG: BatD family protein [Epsilonproteobacteria bacterium]|nr:BatD family protein [Campylobacterota bacterium]
MIRTLGSVVLWLIFFSVTQLQAGLVEAKVDHSTVVRGDSVQLTITVIGEEFDNIPDIPSIAGVDVLNSHRSHSTNYTYVNGQGKSELSESLILAFQPDKNITIPPFKIKVDGKVEESEPILIEVVEPSNKILSIQKFRLEIELDKKSVYLGEPIIATVNFKQRKDADVMRLEYEDPSFKLFFAKLISKEKSYNDGDYTVHQVKYLLMAKTKGELTLDPVRARVAEPVRKRDFIGFMTTVPKWTNLSTGSQAIEVKEPSGDYTIVGNYQINDGVDTQKVETNKPVNLTIRLRGEGSLEDFEGVTFDIPGVTVYSDDAKVETKIVGNRLESYYTKSYAFIADHDFTIPSMKIRAYDYRENAIKILSTKAYDITVSGGAKATENSAVYTKNSVDATPSKAVSQERSKTIVWEVPSWIMLFGAFILGGVVALLAKHFMPTWRFKRKSRAFKNDEALRILYPYMHESAEVESMVRKLYELRAGKKIEIDKEVLKKLLNQYRPKEEK